MKIIVQLPETPMKFVAMLPETPMKFSPRALGSGHRNRPRCPLSADPYPIRPIKHISW